MENINVGMFKKPIIFTADIWKKDTAYLGPRKIDDSPQATFNYGDGKYVIQFHYSKDDKAAERGGETSCQSKADDKKDTIKDGYKPSTATGTDADGGQW
jgi:hypothetical protein